MQRALLSVARLPLPDDRQLWHKGPCPNCCGDFGLAVSEPGDETHWDRVGESGID